MNIKYKIILKVSIFVNIFLVVVLLYVNSNINQTTSSNEYISKSNLDKNLIDFISKKFIIDNSYLKSSGFLSDTLKKNILNNKLVLRFSEFACTTCIDDALNEIKKIKHIIKDSNVLIVTSFSNVRDFEIFKSRFKSNYNFINEYQDFAMVGGLENISSPHFFILDNDLKINSLYVYQKNIKDMNKIYFERIKTEI